MKCENMTYWEYSLCVCVHARTNAERWQAGETSKAVCVDTSMILCLSSK